MARAAIGLVRAACLEELNRPSKVGMGDLLPFRRRRKRTQPGDYGRVLSTKTWQGRPRRSVWSRLKPLVLPILFIAALAFTYFTAQPEEADAPDSTSQRIDPPVTACGLGRANVCVVDGDTIKIGERTIRVIGIDAPELHPPRCMAEAEKGLLARDKLVALANEAPFFLTGSGARDAYDRELFNLVRLRPDKSVQSLGLDMMATGLVRSYTSGQRNPWC